MPGLHSDSNVSRKGYHEYPAYIHKWVNQEPYYSYTAYRYMHSVNSIKDKDNITKVEFLFHVENKTAS